MQQKADLNCPTAGIKHGSTRDIFIQDNSKPEPEATGEKSHLEGNSSLKYYWYLFLTVTQVCYTRAMCLLCLWNSIILLTFAMPWINRDFLRTRKTFPKWSLSVCKPALNRQSYMEVGREEEVCSSEAWGRWGKVWGCEEHHCRVSWSLSFPPQPCCSALPSVFRLQACSTTCGFSMLAELLLMKDKRGSSNSALCLQCWHPSVVRCASLALIGNTCDLILCVCGGIDSPMTRNEGKNTTSIVGILQVKRSGTCAYFHFW